MLTLSQLLKLPRQNKEAALAPPDGAIAIPAADVQVFKTYNTAEAFAKEFGAPPPPPDRNRQRKEWFDPSVAVLDANGRLLNATRRITYDAVEWVDGRPLPGKLTLTVLEAVQVNLPTGVGLGVGEDPNQDIIVSAPPVPVPIRPLSANERIEQVPGPMGAGQWWVVDIDRKLAQASEIDQFTRADRAMLQEILRRLG